MLTVIIAPMDITIYLHPLQIDYIFNSQLYSLHLGSNTITPTRVAENVNITVEPTRVFVMPVTATPTLTITSSPTLPPTETPKPVATFTPPSRPVVPAVSNDGLPEAAHISNIVGHRQLYTLDCESRSAVDLASYFGIGIDEKVFLNRLPRTNNPVTGFVGNFDDPRGQIPPHSYGVYPGPVANLLRSFGLNAREQYGMSLQNIKSEIAAGRPVEVWVVGNTGSGRAVNYSAPDGQNVLVAPYEHTVIVIGYDPSYITILDEASKYQRTIPGFMNSWSILGNMAITVSQ